MGQCLNTGSIELSVFKMPVLTGAVQPQNSTAPFASLRGERLGGPGSGPVLSAAGHSVSLPALEGDRELEKLSCSQPGAGI